MRQKGERIRIDTRGHYFDHDGARWITVIGRSVVEGTIESIQGPVLHVRTDPTPEEPHGTLLKVLAFADSIQRDR